MTISISGNIYDGGFFLDISCPCDTVEKKCHCPEFLGECMPPSEENDSECSWKEYGMCRNPDHNITAIESLIEYLEEAGYEIEQRRYE